MSSTLDYFPTLDGQSYDPVDHGGAVSLLVLTNSVGAQVASVGPAAKIADGRYRFSVPDLPAGDYTYAVTWTMTGSSGPFVDSGQSISLPTIAPPNATSGIGDWTTLGAVRARPRLKTGVTDAIIASSIDAASDLLYVLSGRQFPGIRADVVRPQSGCTPVDYSRPWWGSGWGGPWSIAQLAPYADSWLPAALASWGQCGCNGVGASASACEYPSRILLGGAPIATIDSVLLDGVLLTQGVDFDVHDDRWLVYLGATNCAGCRQGWPTCQNLTLPATATGTLQVTYTWGVPPPPSGVTAATRLALELANLQQSGACDLPSRVTTVVREGTTIAVLDNMDVIAKGRTGIAEVDLFLAAYNPGGDRQPAFIHSPDLPATVTRTRI